MKLRVESSQDYGICLRGLGDSYGLRTCLLLRFALFSGLLVADYDQQSVILAVSALSVQPPRLVGSWYGEETFTVTLVG